MTRTRAHRVVDLVLDRISSEGYRAGPTVTEWAQPPWSASLIVRGGEAGTYNLRLNFGHEVMHVAWSDAGGPLKQHWFASGPWYDYLIETWDQPEVDLGEAA